MQKSRNIVLFTWEHSRTLPESSGMMRKPEGRRGASSTNEASIGANMSSAQVPTAFSSIPLHNCQDSALLLKDMMKVYLTLINPWWSLILSALKPLNYLNKNGYFCPNLNTSHSKTVIIHMARNGRDLQNENVYLQKEHIPRHHCIFGGVANTFQLNYLKKLLSTIRNIYYARIN